MTRVVLIGDSIRMGYQHLVGRELAGRAEVWAPEANGGNSANVYGHLDDWIVAQRPDVVHVNCGLHDIKTEFGTTAKAVEIGVYRYFVGRILAVARATGARAIWAATTPVNHAWHHANKEFDRFEADVRAYNAVAAEVAGELDVPVNDLYTLVMQAGRDRLLLPDGVHLTPEGYGLLGRAVAAAIAAHI